MSQVPIRTLRSSSERCALILAALDTADGARGVLREPRESKGRGRRVLFQSPAEASVLDRRTRQNGAGEIISGTNSPNQIPKLVYLDRSNPLSAIAVGTLPKALLAPASLASRIKKG